MKSPPQDPGQRQHDPDSTDTLPLPVLGEDDTGRFAALDAPAAGSPGDEAVRVRPRVTVRDGTHDPHSSTDTFHPAVLVPMAARPVAASDLAETLREQEQRLQQTRERLAQAEEQARETARRLEQAEQRAAQAEAQLEQASQRAMQAEAQLQQAEQRASQAEAQLQQAEQRASQAEAQLQQAGQRLAESQAQLAATPDTPPPPAADGELDALRRQNRRLHEALSSLQARLGVQEAMLAEAEDALRAAQVAPAGPAVGVSDPTSVAVQAQARTQASTPAPAPAPDAHAADPAAREGAPAREGALRIDWQARFNELETVLEVEREAGALRAREQAGQLAALQAQLEQARQPQSVAASAPLPIGTLLRVLVREEDGTELVYPLGRHTTIGRTPDNDIQVNTTFVSRHHAVLLTSSEHCIVEDLNSTNGIIVNGQRVGRQLLHDGDVLTIGKTHFRYETRP